MDVLELVMVCYFLNMYTCSIIGDIEDCLYVEANFGEESRL